MLRLPTELLSHLVDCLIHSDPPVAYSASHLVTRTLLSLTLVSKRLRPAATRSLLAHCLYIDSFDRLKLFLRSVRDVHPSPEYAAVVYSRTESSASPYSGSTAPTKSLFLAPFANDSI